QYCESRHEPDRFLIHHGNLSASYRETAEEIMKDDSQLQTTVTTATLELGIDIGRLERAFQIDAPFMVSSFLQRLGRTGRRDQPPEMWFVIREDMPEVRAMLPTTVPWKLLQGIALVQLYLEERWVEPPKLDRLPFSLLYHQTMSTLASCGELTAAQLAERVLTLSVFHRITKDDYRELLRHLLETEQIQRTEEGGLIVGLAGERVINSFKFYAVFQESEEYTVRCGPQALGTIVSPPPVGEKLALAGHVWIVEEIDHKRRLIYCEPVKGKVPAYFGECPGDIQTHVLERMRRVLKEDIQYPYLMENAVSRLETARRSARNSGAADIPLVCLGGNMWCLFPWLGTYAFFALERFLKRRCKDRLGLSSLDSSRPYFIQFKMKADPAEFFEVLWDEAEKPIDPMELVYDGEVPLFEKYDEYVPASLVRKGFAYGILDIEGMLARVRSWKAQKERLF
ncbi:MAG: ATP-dependent helicase, partial [Clostridia bacterium]|nr:ATP-dependent helicase [Clostridia bacterium]